VNSCVAMIAYTEETCIHVHTHTHTHTHTVYTQKIHTHTVTPTSRHRDIMGSIVNSCVAMIAYTEETCIHAHTHTHTRTHTHIQYTRRNMYTRRNTDMKTQTYYVHHDDDIYINTHVCIPKRSVYTDTRTRIEVHAYRQKDTDTDTQTYRHTDR